MERNEQILKQKPVDTRNEMRLRDWLVCGRELIWSGLVLVCYYILMPSWACLHGLNATRL